jgi:hypothetical protein
LALTEHANPWFCSGSTQFATINPGIRANSETLLVTSTKPWLRTWAEVMADMANPTR